MTELICGSAGSGKGAYIVEKIREKLKDGKKMYLLVPEQEAVIWEGRVCRELPPRAAACLEVVNFRRLADAVARREGGLSRASAADGKKLLLMWSAILSVRENLTVYAADDGFEDKYAARMLETVSEMRRNRITPAMLERAAELLTEGNETLSRRLRDLAAIYSAYSEICAGEEAGDSDDILDSLAEKLRRSDFFEGADVFIDSFYSLTPVENEILYYILKGAENVYITFDFDRENRGIHFEHVREFYKKACRLSDRAGKAYTTVDLKENHRTEREGLRYIEKNLWNFAAPTAHISDGSVRAVLCEDRYEEARAVCALIEKFVHEGARYSDIAVISGDMEALRGIIDTRLDALHIPYHLSERWELRRSPAVKLISSLLACVRSGCRREDVIGCLKTGLCPVSDRECANFEQYTETWNIHGKKAYIDTEVWSMNPAGYSSVLDDWGRTVLRDANRVKGVIAEEIRKLYAVFASGEAAVRDICEALCGVTADFGVWERLCFEADCMREAGRAAAGDAEEKIYSLILSAFDTMAETVGDVKIDAARFSRLFLAVASSLDTGTIPAGVDMVTLGSAFGVRTGELKHVILVGCVEGEFPGTAPETGFFSDAEKTSLESVGIVFSDNGKERLGEELFRFWRACAMPRESLSVMIPRSGASGVLYPSIGAKRIMKLLNLTAEDFSASAEREAVWSARGGADNMYMLGAKAREAILSLAGKYPEIKAERRQECRLDADFDSVTPEVSRLVFKDRVYLTQARIDKFSKCRFSYYMSYLLGLKEPSVASVSFADAGNFIHGILERFFYETREREYPVPDGETEELVSRITEEYIAGFMAEAGLSSRQKYLFLRLRRSALMIVKLIMKELEGSSFRPYKFELKIGGDGGPDPLVFDTGDGGVASVSGIIDRVDILPQDDKVYVKVIDYKTGAKKFTISDEDIGANLQLMIYLFTLCKGSGAFADVFAKEKKEILPAGMMYYASITDVARSDRPMDSAEESRSRAEKVVSVSGMMLRDFCGEGEDKKKKSPISAASLEDFEELYGKTCERVADVTREMKSGVCGSVPVGKGTSSPCRYCKLHPVCRHTEREERGGDD